jgi:hypothetical protein
MFMIPNKKKKMHKVSLLSKLYLNCIDKIKLSDDYKHFESEIMRDIAYNLLSTTSVILYFLHIYNFYIL